MASLESGRYLGRPVFSSQPRLMCSHRVTKGMLRKEVCWGWLGGSGVSVEASVSVGVHQSREELVGQVEGTAPILRAANLAQLLSASAIRLAAGER